MRLLSYLWLLIGKCAALAFIFAGGGLLAAFILPLVTLWPGTALEHAHFLIRTSFRLYLLILQSLRLIHLEINGKEKLEHCGGKMIIANHPSLLDVVILVALLPKVQCIVKHELWDHWLLGGLMHRAGYIRNDLNPEILMANCKKSLENGECLIIFPEGTRTPPGSMPRFQRGFANIATLTSAPIQLVLITCTPPFLYKGEPWWHVPQKPALFRVDIGDSLDAGSYLLYGERSIAARKLVESLELYYAKHLRD